MPIEVMEKIEEIAAWLRSNCGVSAQCSFPGVGRVIVFACGAFTVCA